MPEFYMIFALKIFSRLFFFFWGASSVPPISNAYSRKSFHAKLLLVLAAQCLSDLQIW